MGIPLSLRGKNPTGGNPTGGILDLRAVKEAGQELLKIKVTQQRLEICLIALNGQVIKSLSFV